ncbi:NAD(P)H-hydrate epimerase [Frigoribacterium sp. PhB24]|uniref:NAD(P)H-hydrate epimerase n=1 Tax=Frigoribacterium sp. PhB24 TaxID=2485204 RepID=UPI000F474515|nr:NAD(P)H-hydrate epimerase [Frigoribacterium sp. PhB24]ROS52724.1 NAD(P)H-hydrate repair Nnr-like enzyme with NAD(P)H-hydrate epimerase domain [Frigoribacterium sp. PhB24]
MVDAWTAAQIREAERPHLEAGEPLMQRAADGLAEVVRDLLRASSVSRYGRAARVLLLAGSGNNGGDTLFAGEPLARELLPRGGAVTVVPVGTRVHEAALAAALDAGAALDDVGPWCDPEAVAARLPGYDVVLDGLVGTGSSGVGLRGDALRVVRAMLPVITGADSASTGGLRRSAPLVIAVDVPSGIGVDDGALPEPPLVLPADVTVTFGGHKVGLLAGPGSGLAGRVVLVDIGLGSELARVTPAFSTR